MAEFCKDCFKELFIDDYTDDQLVISDDLDICEGCAKFKQVVIKIIE